MILHVDIVDTVILSEEALIYMSALAENSHVVVNI